MLADDDIEEYASGVALIPQADAVELASLAQALRRELAEAVDALRGLCLATGDESEEEGLAIWMRADEVVALHDDEEGP